MNWYKVVQRVGVVAAAAGSLVTAAAATGSAATRADVDTMVTCSGTRCDGKDPVDSGCSAGSTTIHSVRTSKGTFELRWSSVCKTNWIRVTNYAGGGPYLHLDVWDYDRNKYVAYNASTSAGLHYGNMVYSPAANCVLGYGDWVNNHLPEVTVYSSAC